MGVGSLGLPGLLRRSGRLFWHWHSLQICVVWTSTMPGCARVAL